MANSIKVSVVMAAWNSAQFITQAIDSVLQQTNVELEVLVVDDASTDNTVEVVSKHPDPRVKVITSEQNGGPGAARNIGFQAAQGEWIAVVDSDDAMKPERLATMLKMAADDTDIIIDNFCEQMPDGKQTAAIYNHAELPVGTFSLAHLIATNLMFSDVHSTGYVKPLFRNAFIKQHQVRYWPEVKIGEDYYFLANCLAFDAKAQVVDYCGYIYTIREGSISRVINIEHIDTLLKYDTQLVNSFNFDADATKAQQYRTQNMHTARKYLEIVAKLKHKNLSAFIDMIKYPQSALLLSLPVKKRLNKVLNK
ncbi:glycosyltransferase family 2 protein [Photobacterium lucens]|uniref:glycosyltransferase family 2 protein n=1 Tax=Photobacterium lucens TaxID=2562949 RepID=UPI00136EDE60|nr:glycosyltransferase family 2 protein [Photobacterium lucens]MBP2700490.1 glycosyltransferase family 2 protein [Vibrio parahaemolyticus]MZG57127.1 glycosyltransferase family 2 protein [Photobacterium lucens]MZG81450.1 glycosyltransferase family 2 protein [Photobacterium lucens]